MNGVEERRFLSEERKQQRRRRKRKSKIIHILSYLYHISICLLLYTNIQMLIPLFLGLFLLLLLLLMLLLLSFLFFLFFHQFCEDLRSLFFGQRGIIIYSLRTTKNKIIIMSIDLDLIRVAEPTILISIC